MTLLNKNILKIRQQLMVAIQKEIVSLQAKYPNGISAANIAGLVQDKIELKLVSVFNQDKREFAPAVLLQSFAIVQSMADILNGGNEKELVTILTTIAKFVNAKNAE